jgi:hypothetical protein
MVLENDEDWNQAGYLMSGFSWSRITVMNLDHFVHIPKWGKMRALPDHFGVSNALLTAPAVHKMILIFLCPERYQEFWFVVMPPPLFLRVYPE